MSKIEKTLELNITHELISLADSFWWYLQPISLKLYWRPHWRFPFMAQPQSYVTGLPINLEGRAGGGYDVCLHSPSNFQGGNPRLLFMQFKAGVERPFNTNPASIFHGNAVTPSIHVEFDINSNANHNQHRLLRDLATNAGNGNAVVYAFPRIVNVSQLEQNIGKLLSKTSFISISEMDDKATANGVNIDDGSAHKFRTCYNNYNKNEVNYFYYFFGPEKKPGGMIGEIFAIRMNRALQALQKVQIDNYPISKYHIMDAMIRHVVNIGMHFSIQFNKTELCFEEYPSFKRRLNYLYEYADLPKAYQIEISANEYVVKIFDNIIQSLSQYFKWIEQVEYFKDTTIPNPPSEYTVELNSNGIRYGFESNIVDRNVVNEDFEDITYSLF